MKAIIYECGICQKEFRRELPHNYSSVSFIRIEHPSRKTFILVNAHISKDASEKIILQEYEIDRICNECSFKLVTKVKELQNGR